MPAAIVRGGEGSCVEHPCTLASTAAKIAQKIASVSAWMLDRCLN
jgi:hypothetical protein